MKSARVLPSALTDILSEFPDTRPTTFSEELAMFYRDLARLRAAIAELRAETNRARGSIIDLPASAVEEISPERE
jgi:hypothetical protein